MTAEEYETACLIELQKQEAFRRKNPVKMQIRGEAQSQLIMASRLLRTLRQKAQEAAEKIDLDRPCEDAIKQAESLARAANDTHRTIIKQYGIEALSEIESIGDRVAPLAVKNATVEDLKASFSGIKATDYKEKRK